MFFKTGFITGLLAAVMSLCSGCVAIPDGLRPVTDFDLKRYLGTWYEIARLDHSFERGLINVQAEYTPRKDGGINVINTGYDPKKKVWKKATGKGYFTASADIGQLKVSFFGPFYGAYNILVLDKDYSYALVCGPTRNYLWILSRTPVMDEATRSGLIDKAKNMGFDTDKLIFVEQ
jgi:apolipoprotein D and lipocalin family protein